MKFSNLKIRQKLLIGFFTVIVVLIVVGIICYIGLYTVGSQLNEVATNRLPGVEALNTIIQSETAIKTSERSLLIDNYPDPNFRKGEYKHIEDNWQQINYSMDTL